MMPSSGGAVGLTGSGGSSQPGSPGCLQHVKSSGSHGHPASLGCLQHVKSPSSQGQPASPGRLQQVRSLGSQGTSGFGLTITKIVYNVDSGPAGLSSYNSIEIIASPGGTKSKLIPGALFGTIFRNYSSYLRKVVRLLKSKKISTLSPSASKVSGIVTSKVNSFSPAVAVTSGVKSCTKIGAVFSGNMPPGEINTEKRKLDCVPACGPSRIAPVT